MSTFVTGLETHQYVAYRKEAILKAQQEESMWEGTCVPIPLEGKMTSLDAYGTIEWYAREQAGEANKVSEIERDRRWIASSHFANTQRWERTEDHKNLHRFEPNGFTTRATLAAWSRLKDGEIWTAFDADVPYGEKGNKLAVYATQVPNNLIGLEWKESDAASLAGTGESDTTTVVGAIGDVEVIDTSGGTGVEVGMNLAKLRKAQQVLLDQDIGGTMLHVACHSRQINDLLNSSRFTEMDNQSMTSLGVLGDKLEGMFKGMMWKASTQATQHTSGYRYVFMYTDRAMVCGKVNGSVDIRLDELVGNHHMRQLAMYADFGAVRRIDEEVVRIDCKDNWG